MKEEKAKNTEVKIFESSWVKRHIPEIPAHEFSGRRTTLVPSLQARTCLKTKPHHCSIKTKPKKLWLRQAWWKRKEGEINQNVQAMCATRNNIRLDFDT